MNQKKSGIVLVLFFLVIVPVEVFGEHLFLKNGKIIECRVIKETPAKVTVELKNGKRTVFTQSRVLRVLYTELYMGLQHVRLVDGKVFQAYMVDEDQDSFTFRKELYSPVEFKVSRSEVLFLARNNPNKLKGTADYTSAELTWLPPVGNVKRYNIYIKKKFGTYPKKPSGTTTSTRYVFRGLKSDTAYSAIVTTVNKKGKESLPSNEIDLQTLNYAPVQPGRPRMVIAHDRPRNKVDVEIKWDAADDVDGYVRAYKVFLKKRGAGDFDLLDTLKADFRKKSRTIHYTLKGLDNNKDYTLAVSALDNRNLESQKRGVLNFSTSNRTPNSPFPVREKKKVAGKKLTVILSWPKTRDPDGKVEKYRIYRKIATRNKKIGETVKTSFAIAGLNPDRRYNFTVSAVDNRGGESFSRGIRKLVDPGINVMARGYYVHPYKAFDVIFDYGAGASLSAHFDSFAVHGLSLGLEIGYWQLMCSHELVDSSFMAPFTAEIAYKFDIQKYFRLGLYVSGGGAYTSVTHVKDVMPFYGVTEETSSAFEAVVGCGILMEFVIKKTLVLELRLGYLGVVEPEIMHMFPISLGAGYRFDMPGRRVRDTKDLVGLR